MYSYNACTVQCRRDKQLKLCNCTSHLTPNSNSAEHCDVMGLDCLSENYEILNKPIAKWSTDRKGIHCDCPPLCTDSDITLIGETKQR